jgi:hypothetical protein
MKKGRSLGLKIHQMVYLKVHIKKAKTQKEKEVLIYLLKPIERYLYGFCKSLEEKKEMDKNFKKMVSKRRKRKRCI